MEEQDFETFQRYEQGVCLSMGNQFKDDVCDVFMLYLSHDMNHHHCGSMTTNHFLHHVTFKFWVYARVSVFLIILGLKTT